MRDVEELGAYVAISTEPQPRKSNLIEIAAKFVRSCSPHADPSIVRTAVGGRAAILVEWLDGAWRCAAWFVPSTRGKVLVVEALVDPGRHPTLPATSFGGQLVELIEWLPSTRDPRAVPGASVIRPSLGASSKRDFVLSFSSDTPDEEILRRAKEVGIGLTRAYLQAIREAQPAKPRGRKAPAKSPSASNGKPGGKPKSLLERIRDELRLPTLLVSHAAAEVERLAGEVVMLD